MGKVSVVIPVYNTEEYIETCLNSVLEQTYEDIEILLINDGSDKNCSAYLEKLSKIDARVKLIHSEVNKGVGHARNLGIANATGTFIYFLDSDDYIPRDTLELLVSHINDNEMIKGSIRNTYLNRSFVAVFQGLFNPTIYTDNRFELFKGNSILNCLIRRDFIQKHNLSFNENIRIFSDLPFIIEALINTEYVFYLREAVYFKRKRNDPFSNPSLSQSDEKIKIKNFFTMYKYLKDRYKDKHISHFLDKQFLNYYRQDIIVYLKNSTNIDGVFQDLVNIVKYIDKELIQEYDLFFSKELLSLKSGKIKKFKRLSARFHFYRDLRDALKSKRQFKQFLYKRVFTKLPMNNKLIFFESFLGKNYSDSPKYIYEYLINTKRKGYKFVWSFNEKTTIPGNAKQVKRFSLPYFYYLARAKYWVSNSRLPKYLDKREGNIYLQTWHGTPLKKLVFDMEDVYSADPNYKENFYYQSRRWDYLSSANEYSTEIFRRAFKYDKEILEFGYPRNDILYQKNNDHDINRLKKQLKIPEDKKVILYAPTWRDDAYFSRGKYSFELQLDLEKMRSQLGNEYIILLRMHYFIANQIDLSGFEEFAYDFSSYDDIAELYLVSDILITDYSSVFFDYAHLKRPILFYTYDLEKYRDQLRGFYLDIEREVPGPLLMTTEEIIDAIKNIEQVSSDYSTRYNTFYNRFCKWDDGSAAKKTVETIFK